MLTLLLLTRACHAGLAGCTSLMSAVRPPQLLLRRIILVCAREPPTRVPDAQARCLKPDGTRGVLLVDCTPERAGVPVLRLRLLIQGHLLL